MAFLANHIFYCVVGLKYFMFVVEHKIMCKMITIAGEKGLNGRTITAVALALHDFEISGARDCLYVVKKVISSFN